MVYLVPNIDNYGKIEYLQQSDTSYHIINLHMGSAYINDYSTGAAIALDGVLTLSQWHKIQIEFDHTAGLDLTGQYTLYVDDVSRGTVAMDSFPGEKSRSFTYASSSTAGIKYIDDIKLSDGAPETCVEALRKGYDLSGDVNKDCYVNLVDYAMIAEDWMECNDPENDNCLGNWF